MSNSSIWPIDMTLSIATTPRQSGPGSTSNKVVHRIPQSSNITVVSPSDCLVSKSGHSLGKFYPSAEMQSVYSSAQANWDRLWYWKTQQWSTCHKTFKKSLLLPGFELCKLSPFLATISFMTRRTGLVWFGFIFSGHVKLSGLFKAKFIILEE